MSHLLISVLVMTSGWLWGGEIRNNIQTQETPANVAAALILKVAAYERNISDKAEDVTVYVMGAVEVADELRKGIGKSVGNSTLNAIEEGDGLPSIKPSILYIGDESRVNEALEYTRSNKILSVTGKPSLVTEGVTLGIGISDSGKPEIIINLSSSVEEGLDWNASIMRVAKTIK